MNCLNRFGICILVYTRKNSSKFHSFSIVNHSQIHSCNHPELTNEGITCNALNKQHESLIRFELTPDWHPPLVRFELTPDWHPPLIRLILTPDWHPPLVRLELTPDWHPPLVRFELTPDWHPPLVRI